MKLTIMIKLLDVVVYSSFVLNEVVSSLDIIVYLLTLSGTGFDEVEVVNMLFKSLQSLFVEH